VVEQFWPLLTVLAFWGWVGAVVGFILSAFPAGGVFCPVPARRWGSLCLLLFALWIVAMSQA
jgi:hypothetical protein